MSAVFFSLRGGDEPIVERGRDEDLPSAQSRFQCPWISSPRPSPSLAPSIIALASSPSDLLCSGILPQMSLGEEGARYQYPACPLVVSSVMRRLLLISACCPRTTRNVTRLSSTAAVYTGETRAPTPVHSHRYPHHPYPRSPCRIHHNLAAIIPRAALTAEQPQATTLTTTSFPRHQTATSSTTATPHVGHRV